MSSEKLHITRQNYEEYFLLYVDNELSPAQKMAVEAFAASHPDLREELDLLLHTTTFASDTTSLGDKSFLMADSMKLNAIDDSLLLYLDNELSGAEKAKVEKSLKSDPDYKLQFDLLQQTKLDKEEIVYPYKNELYRRTERKAPVYWMRAAAAIIVVIALGLLYFLKGTNTDEPLVAKTSPVQTKQVQPEDNQVAVVPAPVEVKENTPAKETKAAVIPGTNVVREPKTEGQQIALQNDPVPVNDVRKEDAAPTNEAVVVAAVEPVQQIINTDPVTTTKADTYKSIENPNATSPADYAIAEPQKSGSVRGLLRKATRFIEKRTGVNPVNDDDELLIGALAIKLK